jgi:predicted GNAT family acetyltransferase
MSSLLRRPAELRSHNRPLRVEQLDNSARAELTELADTDPIVNAVVSSRLHAVGSLDARDLGGTALGVRDDAGRLTGAAFNGGNLLPIGGGPAEWEVLARHLGRRRRACSSIVGPADTVAGMWRVLAAVWGPARAVRAQQPLLALDGSARPRGGHPAVRRIRPVELDAYLSAASAMFTEELGITPQQGAGPGDYRNRVARLIADGRAFGVVDDTGSVLFKADIGAISPSSCQVQGVWVRPDLRARGLGTAALAEVFRQALTLAPSVSLYVNDYNVAARRVYERLGMWQVATLSTVLF